jgi:hypothetical protein
MKRKRLCDLDRSGGRDKIARATYSPQQYRRENSTSRSGGSGVLWLIAFLLFCLLYIAIKTQPAVLENVKRLFLHTVTILAYWISH